MKVIAVTPFHNRPEISRIFWQNSKDIGLDVIAVVSDRRNRQLANKYALETIWANNRPLGGKWLKGIKALEKYDYDYLLFLGSDDIISKRLLHRYKKEFDKGVKYLGLQDAVAMDYRTKKFRLFQGYQSWRKGESLGSGRLIHRSILEALNYDLFEDNINFGIDGSMNREIYTLGIVNKMIRTGLKPYRIGIKVGNALNKEMPNSPFVYDLDLTGYYSEKVIEMLKK